MNYAPSKYRLLGIGETVVPGLHYVTQPDWRENTEIPAGSHWAGFVVNLDDDWTFLEPLAKPQHDTYPSGAARSASEGRGRFDLIPYEAMLSLARRYEMGAATFGDRNWERGQPLSRLMSSLRRHAHQVGWCYKEDHIGAVLWNAAAFVTMVERMRAGILPRELDDIGFFANEEATKP